MKTAVVWFRNDLRLSDNETLYKAVQGADQIIPLYIFDPRQYRHTSLGFHKTGPYRTNFIIESVAALRASLQQLGSNLVIEHGCPEDVLPLLCLQYGAKELWYSKEVAPDEVAVEEALAEALTDTDIQINTCSTDTLIPWDSLPFSVAAMPDMFTAFRWQVEKNLKVPDLYPAPTHIHTPTLLAHADLPTVHYLIAERADVDTRRAIHFKGGEEEAILRLKHYLWDTDAIATYFETRNGLVGPDYSSKLSAWLAFGCISPRTIYHEVKVYERARIANKSTYWLIFELLWRDFFRFNMAKYHCELFFIRGPRRRNTNLANDKEKLEIWRTGNTGQPFVDANMKELLLTGFMSNRGRQIVASYLVNDMNVSWLYGAAWFESCLIDYDVCSNYGNWAYVAGVGNDPRENRYFNIDKQAANYDPNADYRKLWLKQSAKIQ